MGFGGWAIENQDLAQVGDGLGAGFGAHPLQDFLSRLAIVAVNANLDQFMGGERAVGFGEDVFSEAGVTHHHYGMQVMGEAFQIAALGGGKHGGGF